jgi:hypothetical protein
MRTFVGLFGLSLSLLAVSCGPSAEEQQAMEKLRQDSIAAAQAQLEAAKEAARQQMIEDSIRQADTMMVKP